jgi:hypothetical protein
MPMSRFSTRNALSAEIQKCERELAFLGAKRNELENKDTDSDSDGSGSDESEESWPADAWDDILDKYEGGYSDADLATVTDEELDRARQWYADHSEGDNVTATERVLRAFALDIRNDDFINQQDLSGSETE